MSDAPRCEPPPELRGRDWWHWVQLPFVAVPTPIAWMCNPDNQEREWRMPSAPAFVSGESKTARTWRYLSPVLTPAEVATLRAERDDWKRLCSIAEPEVADLRARVAVLEGALWEALETLGGVLAWHLTPEQYHKHGLRAEDAAAAWSDVRPAIKTARAALSPTPAATQPSELCDGDHPA